MSDSNRILIAGVGNVLLSDDGVGIHAVRELQQRLIPGVEVVEIGTAILHGLHFLEAADRVLVIDAARGGQPPGTIYLFDAAKSGQDRAVNSIHALGLREAARFMSPGRSSLPMTILGVEPESLGYGMNLSAMVQAALPKVIDLARETVARWRRFEPAEEIHLLVEAWKETQCPTV